MKIEDDNIQGFLRAIRASGIGVEDAALAADLPPLKVMEWLETGRLEDEHIAKGGRIRKKNVFPLELWREYSKARAKAKGRLLALLQEHAKDDWRATKQAMDYLNAADARTEREDPAYYMGGH